MIGNASYLEIFWTLTGVLGLGINLWALNDAIADLRWLEARSFNGARERVARGNARDETLRAVIQFIFICIGLVAMATPPANTARPLTPLTYVITGGIVAAQVVLVVKAIMGRRDRQWLISYLNRALARAQAQSRGERGDDQ